MPLRCRRRGRHLLLNPRPRFTVRGRRVVHHGQVRKLRVIRQQRPQSGNNRRPDGLVVAALLETRAARVALYIQPAAAAFQPHRGFGGLQHLRPVVFERQALQLLPDFGRRRRQQGLVDGLARGAQFAPAQSAQQQVRRRTVRVFACAEISPTPRSAPPRRRDLPVRRTALRGAPERPAPPSLRPALPPPPASLPLPRLRPRAHLPERPVPSPACAAAGCAPSAALLRAPRATSQSRVRRYRTSHRRPPPAGLSDSRVASKAASRLT